MAASLEKSVSDMSLLSVMVDPGDTAGLEALLELLKQSETQATTERASDKRLLNTFAFVSTQVKAGDQNATLVLIKTFVPLLQTYLAGNDKVTLPGETSTEDNGELADYFDAEFLPDFVAKHTMLLEEFEGTIADFRFQADNATEESTKIFQRFLKSYLHNLKGDAGSVGLAGIEKVTHALEDRVIATANIRSLLDLLIEYKEWALDATKALANGEALAVSSTEFLKRFAAPTQASAKISSSLASAPASQSQSANAVETYVMEGELELLSEFIAEANDHIESFESLLLEKGIELDLNDIATAFRAVHSLKGASSYFKLKDINETSHQLESTFDEVRAGKRVFDNDLLGLSYRYIDLQKKLLVQANDAAKRDNTLHRDPQAAEFISHLSQYRSGSRIPVPNIVEVAEPKSATNNSSVQAPAKGTSDAAAPSAATAPASDERSSADKNVKSFVKVDTTRLDSLIDSIGEMVIYSSMLISACREHLSDNEAVMKSTHQVEKFSRHLQDIGMSMRLDPVKALFQKMSRIVWDTSKKVNKEISFQMYGEDTELDRNVIEKLADPLMHMIRNAVDHGIETPEDRLAAGKPRAGHVELRAFHAGGSIHIVIKDDGKGLNPEKLRAKGIEKGIIGENQTITDLEALNLIFAPGFSTAAQVTDISGRGVGMDVVRSNIEGMRGHVRINSEVGKGTTFTIELPLTLAIIDGIELVVGKESFILPTLNVLEFMRPDPEMIKGTLGKAESFLFRGRYLPMFRLANLYGLESAIHNAVDGIVAVVENGGEHVALLVDDIMGSCQTVIKSLGDVFEKNNGLAGCAIMPNGGIGLILDVRSLVELARKDEHRSERIAELRHDVPQTAAQPV